MTNSRLRIWAAWMAVLLAAIGGGRSAWGAEARSSEARSSADSALAQRLAELGDVADVKAEMRLDPTDDPSYRQMVALLEGAHRLNPTEPRYFRLLADRLLRLRKTASSGQAFEVYTAGALEALNAFRKLRPGDMVSQIEVIDLYVSRMETIDQKLKYLRDLLGRESVPPEIRAVVAFRCSQLYREQGRRQEAARMVDEAIKLDPLNLPALTLRYEMNRGTSSRAQRVGQLLAMIRSNPMALVRSEARPDFEKPYATIMLADELAAVGLVKDSITWYSHAVDAIRLAREAAPRGMVLTLASQLYLDGQVEKSASYLEEMFKANAEDYPTLALGLLVGKKLGQKEIIAKAQRSARNVLLNELATARRQLGVQEATTRPVDQDQTVPDLQGDVNRFRATVNPQVRDDYVQSLKDLAWFEVYFDKQPDVAETLLKHLTVLMAEPVSGLSPEQETLRRKDAEIFNARLAGWIYLQRGKSDEAKVKLSAVAADDPMAALGLIRTYGPGEQAQAKEEAGRLLASYPGGLLGALLLDGLREALPDANLQVVPSQQAAGIPEALKSFPADLMKIISRPNAFYLIRAEPLKVVHSLGEPMMVRVAIRNISEHDLTIGHDLGAGQDSISQEGVIHPMLVFSGQLAGLVQNIRLPSIIATERITEQLVLKPRQSISMDVRFDRDELLRQLSRDPVRAIGMAGSLCTNPVLVIDPSDPNADFLVFPAPCGYATEFTRMMERRAPLQAGAGGIDEVLKGVNSENGQERIRSIQLLATVGALLRAEKGNAEAARQAATILQKLKSLRSDSDPSVRAWSAYLCAVTGPGNERADTIQWMLADSAWQTRLLGLAATAVLPTEVQKRIAAQFDNSDNEKFLKDFAAAIMEQASRATAVQPVPTSPASAGG